MKVEIDPGLKKAGVWVFGLLSIICIIGAFWNPIHGLLAMICMAIAYTSYVESTEE